MVELFIPQYDLAGAKFLPCVRACHLPHFRAKSWIIKDTKTGFRHGLHVTQFTQITVGAIPHDLRKPSYISSHHWDFTRHSLESHQSKRLQFTRQEQNVRDRKEPG